MDGGITPRSALLARRILVSVAVGAIGAIGPAAAAQSLLSNPQGEPIEIIGPVIDLPAGAEVEADQTPVDSSTARQPAPNDLPALSAEAQRPLGAPTAESERPLGTERAAPGGMMNHWLVRTALGLGAVLALIAAARFALLRVASGQGLIGQLGAAGRAPSGLLEVLGRYPAARGLTLVLLRVDRRVLLLSQTKDGFSTLAEFEDADDVASILMKSRDEDGESMSARFTKLLQRFEKDPDILGDARIIDAPTAPDDGGGAASHSIRRRLALLREDAA